MLRFLIAFSLFYFAPIRVSAECRNVDLSEGPGKLLEAFVNRMQSIGLISWQPVADTEREVMYVTSRSALRFSIQYSGKLVIKVVLVLSKSEDDLEFSRLVDAVSFLTARIAGISEADVVSQITTSVTEVLKTQSQRILRFGVETAVVISSFQRQAAAVVVGRVRCN